VAEVFPLRDGVLVDFGDEMGTAEFRREEIQPADDAPSPVPHTDGGERDEGNGGPGGRNSRNGNPGRP
jgi:hypothetical protein